jgi:hypothetical protein
MNKVRLIHYIILESGYTLVKFHHVDGGQVYLKSVIRERIKELATHFFIVKSPNVSREDFNEYLESLEKDCYIREKRDNRATIETHNPF